ncbi:hypothetical protein BLA15945_06123 [Burkholderia lata]|uniref:Uncharacterized protein n=1 Tax=Burkholderia lata (strain ATCC 17760 / DSM 23089 / LMG 22485 / NCIMB 9086 / R18194 / 383) TaxID=482957 RepID=A0A6P2QY19_BURL3|nr:hypothetical protein BLA15945_06123 [Burkholderia lata]
MNEIRSHELRNPPMRGRQRWHHAGNASLYRLVVGSLARIWSGGHIG